MSSLTELSTILLRHAPGDGMHPTQIVGLQIMRSGSPTVAMPSVYTPMLCLVAQGRTQAMLGAQAYVYHPQMYLVASVDLSIVGSVIEASNAQPYLCFCLDLDTAVLSELAINHPELVDTQRDAASAGLLLNHSTPQLQDATEAARGLPCSARAAQRPLQSAAAFAHVEAAPSPPQHRHHSCLLCRLLRLAHLLQPGDGRAALRL
ncbi:AraC family transcriptional regulator, partial [Xanthomonas oryzae]